MLFLKAIQYVFWFTIMFTNTWVKVGNMLLVFECAGRHNVPSSWLWNDRDEWHLETLSSRTNEEKEEDDEKEEKALKEEEKEEESKEEDEECSEATINKSKKNLLTNSFQIKWQHDSVERRMDDRNKVVFTSQVPPSPSPSPSPSPACTGTATSPVS